MGCDLQTYSAVVELSVSVLVKIMYRYASIAAKRARGAKVHSMASKFAVASLLAFSLVSGIEPNPGPVGEDSGIQSSIKQLEATFKSALQHEKWYYKYNETPVNVVNSYTYLGFTFTTKLSYTKGNDVFVGKGKKTVFHFYKALMRLKNMTRQTFFKIFDIKIQPQLMYASEIWETERLDNIERVQMIAYKRFLGIPQKTPNKIVSGEVGRYPLFVNSTLRCLKYWLRVLKMEDSRIPKQA